MKQEKLLDLIDMYRSEVQFLKAFKYKDENTGIGEFLGISLGNTQHMRIQGDHFNNIPAYIAYNQFAIAFYSSTFEKRGFSLEELKDSFLKMYVTKFQTSYKRSIRKEIFQGEFHHSETLEPRKNLFIFKNDYSFDNAFFGTGEITVDLR
jgi:hypothetical protein